MYKESDVMTFIGYLSADIPELAGVEVGRFHASWDEFCKRAGLPQRPKPVLDRQPCWCEGCTPDNCQGGCNEERLAELKR